LLLGLESVSGVSGRTDTGRMQWSVDKRFASGSKLRFITFIYNAAQRGPSVTDLAAEIRIYKDGKAVISSPLKKVSAAADADPTRVPFIEEINLGQLQEGRYVLQVTIEDRVAHKSVSQQTAFFVQ
jgi:hypothetical protein